jgi:hypothetical protein
VDLKQLGGLEDVEGRHQVVVERGDVGREGCTRNGCEMDDGIDAAVDLVDAGEGLDDLAVVGEVGADEAGPAVR